MEARFGRVATPAIVIGSRVFWGFEYNMTDIADLLGVDVDVAPVATPGTDGSDEAEA
jgi:hypothetical protein